MDNCVCGKCSGSGLNQTGVECGFKKQSKFLHCELHSEAVVLLISWAVCVCVTRYHCLSTLSGFK